MEDFIVLRCPSCGGQIQVGKNLEKIFCINCGTQLILRQGADGLLTPMMARDLTASAKLKEAQAAMMVAEIIKTQIKELEQKACGLRKAFFVFCFDHVFYYHDMNRLRKTLESYQKSIGLDANTLKNVIWEYANINWRMFYKTVPTLNIETLITKNTPGCNTAEDIMRIYQFITQPKYYEKEASKLALILQPITQIAPELQKKKQALQKALDSVTDIESQ
jgi:ribosomal protein S27E